MRQRDINRQAAKALKGLIKIAENDQLVRGEYISEEITKPELIPHGVCGGRQACAIGSLWLGAGIKPEIENHYGRVTVRIPGTEPRNRAEFLSTEPGLKLAYDLLNVEAEKMAKTRKIDLAETQEWVDFAGSAEALFEHPVFMDLVEMDNSVSSRRATKAMVTCANRALKKVGATR